MDRQTLAAYDKDAAAFAKDWHEQPPPTDLHGIVKRYFISGGITADIGCGSGREVAWLNKNGFPAKGFDASEGLLAEARARCRLLDFVHAELPDLSGIAANAYHNVLCETVIMHLERADIAPSVRRMLDIVRPGGVLYLSWRVTEGENLRDKQDRLYAAFEPALVLAELKATTTLLEEEPISASSGKRIHRVVVRKSSLTRKSPARAGGDRAGPWCPAAAATGRTES
jgi:SAM-dependent methyltransferase